MEMVILDGFTLNPGDLSWKPFEDLGKLTVYERTAPEEVAQRVGNAAIVLTNKAKVLGEAIEQMPGLQYIGELATGFDNIDIKAAAKRNVPVCNVPGYSTHSVAQLTWAFILELTYHTARRSAEVHGGAWSRSKDFCFGHEGLSELQGKTLGLVGLGQIGMAVANIGLAFGMHILAVVRDPSKYSNVTGIEFASREDCFRQADFVSLHCPLTDDTRQMVNAALIATMKPSAFIINTGRGALIQEDELASALKEAKIAGAALDVLSSEPPPVDNPLIGAPNCIITPHIAWATREARQRLLNESAWNIKAFLDGKPRNVVNGVGQ